MKLEERGQRDKQHLFVFVQRGGDVTSADISGVKGSSELSEVSFLQIKLICQEGRAELFGDMIIMLNTGRGHDELLRAGWTL